MRVVEQNEAGGVGSEENPGEDEERNGRQSDAAAKAGQNRGGDEGATHGKQSVSMSHGRHLGGVTVGNGRKPMRAGVVKWMSPPGRPDVSVK
ncbi:hypothetical protein GCM10009757_43450 [Streptomyces cheonanensis]|uniref:Uncharacterized protein n=1 Tax=Streptomyces cheonanensis TaxID=312720 RepID=A0ABP5H201_9ACTN